MHGRSAVGINLIATFNDFINLFVAKHICHIFGFAAFFILNVYGNVGIETDRDKI